MASFAKLDAGIVDSTLWMQPHDVLRVWIAMLAKADATGYVRASVPALAHLCMIPIDRMEQILSVLTSPDPYSRTPEDEGRRLRPVEGGWQIVNYLNYRNARDADAERERKREWDRQNRPSGHARQSDAVRRSPTWSDEHDAVRRGPTHAEAEAEEERAFASGEDKSSPPATPSCARVSAKLDEAAHPQEPPSPPVVWLPLVGDGEYPITEAQVREFSDLYPAVDVPQELRAMRGWCVTNPTNRKTKSGVLRFVNRWLAKAQNTAPAANRGNANGSRHESAADRAARLAREGDEREMRRGANFN